jgi:drug/metabolite transporter (DMT)-like permease
MNKFLWIALLVVGVILIVLGVQGMNSLESDVSRFFRGTPTDKSVWMLVGGILCAIGGAVGLMRR